jgi:hypothetical protein
MPYNPKSVDKKKLQQRIDEVNEQLRLRDKAEREAKLNERKNPGTRKRRLKVKRRRSGNAG